MSTALQGDILDEATQSLHLELSTDQRQQLLDYVDLLARWNRTYNLTAVRDPIDMMRQHVVDCLAVVPTLRSHLRSLPVRNPRLVDVGSGAGLPGLVLAMAQPELEVACVDSVGKKASFIAQAIVSLRLRNASAHRARVESFGGGPFEIVTSRAFSSLQNLVGASAHLLSPGGRWMAMKGVPPDTDMAALQPECVFHVEQIIAPGLNAARCVVWIDLLPNSERPLTRERMS